MRARSMLALFLATGSRLTSAQAGRDPIVITNVGVVDVANARVRTGMTVVIEHGRIGRVSPNVAGSAPDHPPIDGTGKFLIPGLWDMHVHLVFGDWFPRAPEVSLPLFVANGVTGVRDMGSDFAPV